MKVRSQKEEVIQYGKTIVITSDEVKLLEEQTAALGDVLNHIDDVTPLDTMNDEDATDLVNCYANSDIVKVTKAIINIYAFITQITNKIDLGTELKEKIFTEK